MLTLSNIEDFLDIIGVIDYDANIKKADDTGDYIETFDTDFDFSRMRQAVFDNRKMCNLIVDNGTNFVEIHDSIYVGGYRTKVGIICKQGIGGFGTTIKMMVKNVQYPFNGELKTFLSFEAISKYLEKHKQIEED